MNEKVVVSILWVIVACMFVGWLAGLVSLRLNEQDWSQMVPPPHAKTSCAGRAAAWACP